VSAKNLRRWAPAGTVLMAAVLWYVTFAMGGPSFWIKISVSAAVLAATSLVIEPPRRDAWRFNGRSLGVGMASAALLYGIFWAGRAVSSALFDFADPQIGGIYQKGTGTPLWVIALLLFFITGPSEEIYWRGYLQRRLVGRLGRWPGWAVATAIYSGVHVCSANVMLVGAAAVAGAFWGAMYARFGNLAPVVVSHSLWSAVIFSVFPIR
jgi:membrane protease YdiL (CAAX protease family)